MANPVKGEVSFECNGALYTFKFGTNAQVIIEDRTKMTVMEYMRSRGEKFGASDLRLLFFAGLFSKHQMSETEVGDLIDSLGQEKCGEIFMRAAGLAAPKGNGAVDPTTPGKTGELIGMNS
jgi:hypothetical protein